MSGEQTTKFERYVEEISEDITETVKTMGCQPILFIGSGLSRRYMSAPSWDELLAHLADQCSAIDKGLGFYRQSLKSPMKIGEEFARLYQEWAWDAGSNEFPSEMFADGVDAQAYLKFKVASHLRNLTPAAASDLGSADQRAEIDALCRIKPHAVITTNYDQMLELVFPNHEPIVGQQLLKGLQLSVGEIYKIHGSIEDHESIVFTQTDYDEFSKKKKFLSAKLLTFFNEHPLIFIGYSASDPNIQSILSDIDEALPVKGGVIPNVYILEWNDTIDQEANPAREKVIPTSEGRSVRVKLIEASDFTWVFNAFAANPVLNDVNPRVLRSLIARSYNMVRHDIPTMTVEADFQMLDQAVSDSDSFAKLFGIANIGDYSAASAQYPLSATQLTRHLGGTGSYLAVSLLRKIKEETGVDIKASDNRYHRAEQVNTSTFHKYSPDMLVVLRKLHAGESYELNME
ncbi:SIR2 family protein [Pseudophaeobacter flagellatus]|uniref:SIR2 family protein n=1 Tax=Pseudophaeobacter flagellatus TaxID=2899119 RepID=UPI001E33A4F3|nr:SIR2 family protein [Pseudophaeobacter flagellatus]MCD9148977.1 SIR2 family protein [Pseudophaeobacter flagellatus]